MLLLLGSSRKKYQYFAVYAQIITIPNRKLICSPILTINIAFYKGTPDSFKAGMHILFYNTEILKYW